jgi:hypothetical protein
LTRGISHLVPADARTSIEASLLKIPKVRKEMKRLGWEDTRLLDYVIALLLAFASLVAVPFVIRRLWTQIYVAPGWIGQALPAVVVVLLPTVFSTGPHYIYDFPALMFFSLGFLLLLQRRWTRYYPILVIGLINKETMAFLLVVFAALYWDQMTRREFSAHLALQAALVVLVRTVLGVLFAANPGPLIDVHLHANIHSLLLGYSFPTLAWFILILWAVLHDLPAKPAALVKSALVVPMFLVAMVTCGTIVELRAAYEVLPITAFLASHTLLFSVLKYPCRPSMERGPV